MMLTKQCKPRQEICDYDIEVVLPGITAEFLNVQIRSGIVDHIKVAQGTDPRLLRIREQVVAGLHDDMIIHEDGSLRFGSGINMPEGEI